MKFSGILKLFRCLGFAEAIGIPAGYVKERSKDLEYGAPGERSWKNYMNLHYQDARRMKADALAKVMVAAMHEYNKAVEPTPFDLEQARREAKLLQKNPVFRQFMKSPGRVRELLNSQTPIQEIANTTAGFMKPFAAPKEDTLRVMRNLKRLGEDFMDPPEGRSGKWADLVTSLRDLGRMNLYSITSKNIKRYEEKLQEIFTKAEAYAKGKKSLRREADGQNRFDQDMDVLAELATLSPAAKHLSQRIFDRTNEVRRKHDRNHTDLEMEQYGVLHAEAHKNPGLDGEEPEIQGGRQL